MSDKTRSITVRKQLCGFGHCMREAIGYSTEHGKGFCELHNPKIICNVKMRCEDGTFWVETGDSTSKRDSLNANVVTTLTQDYRFAARMSRDQAELVVEEQQKAKWDAPFVFSVQVDERTQAEVKMAQQASWHPACGYVDFMKSAFPKNDPCDKYPWPIVHYTGDRVWVSAHYMVGEYGEGIVRVTDSIRAEDIDGNVIVSVPNKYVTAWLTAEEYQETCMAIDADDRMLRYAQ